MTQKVILKQPFCHRLSLSQRSQISHKESYVTQNFRVSNVTQKVNKSNNVSRLQLQGQKSITSCHITFIIV